MKYLFEISIIRFECWYNLNQENWEPTFKPFTKDRKRIEINFAQLIDQYMVMRKYVKQTAYMFASNIGKINAHTVVQYFDYINNKPIDKVKYALI